MVAQKAPQKNSWAAIFRSGLYVFNGLGPAPAGVLEHARKTEWIYTSYPATPHHRRLSAFCSRCRGRTWKVTTMSREVYTPGGHNLAPNPKPSSNGASSPFFQPRRLLDGASGLLGTLANRPVGVARSVERLPPAGRQNS